MSTKSSIANNAANASISDFPGDIPFNPDDAEIISDDDFVNIAIPEKKPQASAPVRKPKSKMVLKQKGQKPDPVETQAVPDAKPQASVPARKPKSKIVLKELPKLKLKGLVHSKSQTIDPVETQAVPDDAKPQPQPQAPARKPKSKMVLKLRGQNHTEHKGQVSPDPVASECVITDDEPENDNSECMSASQEFANRQQETAICDEIINAVSMQDDWAFSYDMLMEMDQFYAYAAVKKACHEAAGCDPIHIEDRDREFVINELVNLMKKLRNILPKPTKDTIRMAGMSYDELRQMARRIARRHGITTPRLKNPANDARTNIRRVLGVHPDDDQVQQDFDAAVIDSRENRVIGMKFNHPDEQGEGTGAFFTAQDLSYEIRVAVCAIKAAVRRWPPPDCWRERVGSGQAMMGRE